MVAELNKHAQSIEDSLKGMAFDLDADLMRRAAAFIENSEQGMRVEWKDEDLFLAGRFHVGAVRCYTERWYAYLMNNRRELVAVCGSPFDSKPAAQAAVEAALKLALHSPLPKGEKE